MGEIEDFEESDLRNKATAEEQAEDVNMNWEWLKSQITVPVGLGDEEQETFRFQCH